MWSKLEIYTVARKGWFTSNTLPLNKDFIVSIIGAGTVIAKYLVRSIMLTYNIGYQLFSIHSHLKTCLLRFFFLKKTCLFNLLGTCMVGLHPWKEGCKWALACICSPSHHTAAFVRRPSNSMQHVALCIHRVKNKVNHDPSILQIAHLPERHRQNFILGSETFLVVLYNVIASQALQKIR